VTKIHWDLGSAYDLFASLHVLYRPVEFGLRPSWAAGVRSRLSPADRVVLDNAQAFLPVPLAWLTQLPAPKDAAAALAALRQAPVEKRLETLFLSMDTPAPIAATLERARAAGRYSSEDVDTLKDAYQSRGATLRPGAIPALLEAWLAPAEFGDAYERALSAYVANFFAEEEQRIAPRLAEGLRTAQSLAGEMAVPELLERLSGGVRFEAVAQMDEITLAPSYWVKPFVFYMQVHPGHSVLLFGARPEALALVPGDTVPEGLLNALKALADPTRLKILRYLGEEPLTPSELAHRLRLRPPTVIHHLRLLRLAGLVQISVAAEAERRYALKPEMVRSLPGELEEFLRR
jgi:DNA-binding transcriptional ArsR family regulator